MKRILLVLCVALLSIGASAQDKGDMAVGANFSYGSDIGNPAIGAKAQYYILDRFRAEAAANYWFKKDDVTYFDINVNVHYLFNLNTTSYIYPLIGVSYLGYSSSVLSNGGNFGGNIGVGVQYNLSSRIGIGAEVKYQFIKDYGQAVLSVGATYKL